MYSLFASTGFQLLPLTTLTHKNRKYVLYIVLLHCFQLNENEIMYVEVPEVL